MVRVVSLGNTYSILESKDQVLRPRELSLFISCSILICPGSILQSPVQFHSYRSEAFLPLGVFFITS